MFNCVIEKPDSRTQKKNVPGLPKYLHKRPVATSNATLTAGFVKLYSNWLQYEQDFNIFIEFVGLVA